VHNGTQATREVKGGGSWSKTSPGKSVRSYLKNKLKAKKTGVWLSAKALAQDPEFKIQIAPKDNQHHFLTSH
jgi:hypothetical protein